MCCILRDYANLPLTLSHRTFCSSIGTNRTHLQGTDEVYSCSLCMQDSATLGLAAASRPHDHSTPVVRTCMRALCHPSSQHSNLSQLFCAALIPPEVHSAIYTQPETGLQSCLPQQTYTSPTTFTLPTNSGATSAAHHAAPHRCTPAPHPHSLHVEQLPQLAAAQHFVRLAAVLAAAVSGGALAGRRHRRGGGAGPRQGRWRLL